jgi:hypothetical protein
MTPGDRIVWLFTTPPPPGSNLDWFVNGLLSIAAEVPSVVLELVPLADPGPISWQFRVEVSGRVLSPEGTLAARVFRPLLARLAVVASEETGTEFQPYGGRYSLTRTGADGPHRLDLEFTNTPASQRLTISRNPVVVSSLV